MSKTAPEIKRLLKDLKSRDIVKKKKAIFKIGESNIKEAVPILIKLLKKDKNNVVRNSSARALGKIRDKENFDEILKALGDALNDPDYYVKVNACWGLGKLKDKRSIPLLTKMVNPNQRLYTSSGDSKSNSSLKESAASNKLKEEGVKFSDVIVSAIKSLGKIKDANAVPILVKALKDENDGAVRCAACLALGKIKDKKAVSPLINLLKTEKYWYVRRDIIKALAKLKDPRAAPILAKKTIDMYDEVREHAFKALFKIGKPAGKEILKLFIENPKNKDLQNFVKNKLKIEDVRGILKELIKKEKSVDKKKKYKDLLMKLMLS